MGGWKNCGCLQSRISILYERSFGILATVVILPQDFPEGLQHYYSHYFIIYYYYCNYIEMVGKWEIETLLLMGQMAIPC